LSIQATEPTKLEDLEFVRLKIPRLIPLTLIESVKGRTFTPEQFYNYQEMQVDNPFNYLRVLIGKDKKIQGFLWCEKNALDGSLFVNTFSISKDYWGKGEAMKAAIGYVGKIKDETNAPHVFWVSTNSKFFKKHGFKESKNVLMEYNPD
jgi:N-acetylglutamate synthase-like GNAT family acetyltransferase